MILKFLKIFKQKKLFFAAVLTMIAAGLFFPSGNAHAGLLESVGGVILDLIAPIIYLIFYVFFYIAYIVAWIGASVINMTLNPAIINSVLNIDPAMPLFKAWAIFRDIANLFFILILLFIAIGTIVRSQSYNLKSLLPKLIIAVFLINFSNVIAGAIIDFGNIFMYGVLKWMCVGNTNKCFTDFYAQLMEGIDILFWKYPITAISFDFKDAASIAIAAIYTFIYGIVLMALGVFLVIRIAAFAILIILSPLAFVGEVFPGLKEISNKWWDNLIKYVMFGPIFALLLYVSGLMAQNTIAVDPAVFETNPNLSGMAQNITLILTNIIPLIFLIGIIPVTKALGIAGADAIFSGAAAATFGGMAVMGRAWGKGQLFPGQNRITKAGGRIGGWALKKSPGLKGWYDRQKARYQTVKSRAKASKAGKVYDVVGKKRGWVEKEVFGETKTLGKYAEMGMNIMNPEKLRLAAKKWMEDSYKENYKIPLGSSPDERRKIEMMDAHKSVNDLKTAGGFDNPERISDKAAKEFKDGNEMTFEILTKLLAAQDKQYKVLSSINRSNGLADTDTGAFTPDAEGWARFLNVYKNKVGNDQASNFGQEVGNLAAKESNWSAGNIAYYDKGVNKIRDIGTAGSRTTAQQAEYDEYVKKNAEDMGKKSIGSKWNNMSADNFSVKLDPLAPRAPINFNVQIKGVATPINIAPANQAYQANELGVEYIKGHMSMEEIERNVGKGKPEEMKKIRDGIAYTIANSPGVFGANLAKAEELRNRLTVVLGK